jgi:spore cortex formation protein SpoVR/YcgB (stage V sporulation)
MSKLVFKHDEDWNEDKLYKIWDVIEQTAKELKVDYYQPEFNIIDSEQMLDAYTSVAMPVMYRHWSFGKDFIQQKSAYDRGHQGLAYEIVINSNPSVCYMMDTNSITMQALVMAHAAVGHSSFFKNNYLFKQWTDADAIIDYLVFAKNFIAKCEEKYGLDEVEATLDAAHALQMFGVDKYKRSGKNQSLKHEMAKREAFVKAEEENYSEFWDRLIPKKEVSNEKEIFEPEENILYFIEKHSPTLKPWQKEVIRIVRKIATYFSPQSQTKVANEGWATFTHHYILTRLHEQGLMDDGSYLEFIASHSSVIYQPEHDKKYYSGLNPYTLGFNIFRDIKRICEHPTDEDREWFPSFAGANWVETVNDAMRNYKDDSFILNFLSPKVMRDMGLFHVKVDNENPYYEVQNISNDEGYRQLRQKLSEQYSRINTVPDIQITDYNKLNHNMTLTYRNFHGIPLDVESKKHVMEHLKYLWGNFDICFNNDIENTLYSRQKYLRETF